jgi:hypothetical protein
VTVITCGRTNLSERAEAITRALRAQQCFCLDVGCGRAFDLDNDIQHIQVYRCFECSRWLCSPCIVAHFEATSDAYVPTKEVPAQTPPPSPASTCGREETRPSR